MPQRYYTIGLLFLFLLISFHASSQAEDKDFAKALLKNSKLKNILLEGNKFKIQILYTPVINSLPGKTMAYRHLPKEYFYPASTVKLPAVLMAFEKANELGLSIEDPMKIVSPWSLYPSSLGDSTSKDGLATIAHYAKKILLVSDNDAYNRLFDFLGPEEFNERMHKHGYTDFHANHRLSIYLPAYINNSKPTVFLESSKNSTVWAEGSQFNEYAPPAKEPILIGKGVENETSIIHEPMDFSRKNHFPLLTQHSLLQAIFFPESVEEKKRFNITEEQLAFLKNYMHWLPYQSDYPTYDRTGYYDSYAKYFMYGDTKENLKNPAKIYNKIGTAYGFMIDNAFIEKGNTTFLLSAIIYVNENEILNDGTYEYDTIGAPFLAELGRAVFKFHQKKFKTK